MKVPIFPKIVRIIKANKVTVIAVITTLVIAVPVTALISGQVGSKGKQSNVIIKSTTPQTAEEPIAQQTPTTETLPKDQTINTQSTIPKTAPKNNGTTAPQTNTPTPTTNQPLASTPATTPAPTILSTCLWQGPQNIGEYCPYDPPSSWSLDYVKYPCRNIVSGELIPCPNYREFTGINNQGYSIDTRGLCQFTISAKKVERNVIVGKPNGTGYPDCMTATPL